MCGYVEDVVEKEPRGVFAPKLQHSVSKVQSSSQLLVVIIVGVALAMARR